VDFAVARRRSLDARPSWLDVASGGIFRVEPNGWFDVDVALLTDDVASAT
jgi:hypothetical protein